MTKYLTSAKKQPATTPDTRGDVNHEMKILMATFQLMDEKPLHAMENPIIQPTTSCVVDTGMPKCVATKSHRLAESSDVNMPSMTTSGSSS